MALSARPWVPDDAERFVQELASRAAQAAPVDVLARIDELTRLNTTIYAEQCIQLNPAANVMNPRAEAAMAAGLGSRPSLGYPGDKYEMGLEAVEEIEVIAAQLTAEVFHADFAEVRIGSGAMANLYAFMACCAPGDPIIVPPATIGGHVTHNTAGAAGLFGLEIHEAPIDADRYTVDVDALRDLAHRVGPKLISLGASLNLHHHPVAAVRTIADEVGAVVLFDAAHLSGLIAGGAWPNPLDGGPGGGAHLMTCSTYKSLGGPPSGVLVTNDAAIAERVDAIAFPGLTANFDAGKTAALAISLLDWKRHGEAYAAEMVRMASALATELTSAGVDVVVDSAGVATHSHAFALHAPTGGHSLAKHLRRGNLLSSGIGLPVDASTDAGNGMSGLRIGTNEIVRWGMSVTDAPELATLIAAALRALDPAERAADVTAFRSRFNELHFID